MDCTVWMMGMLAVWQDENSAGDDKRALRPFSSLDFPTEPHRPNPSDLIDAGNHEAYVCTYPHFRNMQS